MTPTMILIVITMGEKMKETTPESKKMVRTTMIMVETMLVAAMTMVAACCNSRPLVLLRTARPCGYPYGQDLWLVLATSVLPCTFLSGATLVLLELHPGSTFM